MQSRPSKAESQIVAVPSPKEIVLDEIPNALVHTDRQLMEFVGYMNDCFMIKE